MIDRVGLLIAEIGHGGTEWAVTLAGIRRRYVSDHLNVELF